MSSDESGLLREDFEDLYENAPCGYLSLRPDGHVFQVNQTLTRWIGFAPEELLGKHLHDFLTIPGRIFYETHFAPLLVMQGFFDEVALDFMTKDGKRLPVLINAAQRRTEEAEIVVTRLSVFRATERRRYERELLEAREAATDAQQKLKEFNEQLERRVLQAVDERLKAEHGLYAEQELAGLREQFIAVLGHDLRNPLAAFISGIRFIKKHPLTEKQVRIIDLMEGSIDRMSRLIDDVMDFASARLGVGLQLTLKTTGELQPILVQVIEELRSIYPDRQIDGNFSDSPSLHVDAGRIGQMVSNLVANALVHGDDLAPVRASSSIENGELILSVSNSGPAIPLEIQNRLFEPFVRGNSNSNQRGLGLGLFIASEICKAHGGVLKVNSSEKDTCFECRIPIST